MFVALETTVRCQCGYAIRAVMTGQARINKRSVRITGPLIGALGHHACPECGTEVAGEVPRSAYKLKEEDAARVAEYRMRRWGVPSGEVAVERAAG
jgi:hypothetical protein